MGVAAMAYKNCSSEAIECCIPCSRKVIHNEDCSAIYCIHGRLPPGKKYKGTICINLKLNLCERKIQMIKIYFAALNNSNKLIS